MPGTFSQIYIQIVFAVKGRESLIHSSGRKNSINTFQGLLGNKSKNCFAIDGMPDHIHILIGMKLSCCLSDLVREIKKSSMNLSKKKKFSNFKFQWQEGYGAFHIAISALDKVIAIYQTIKRTSQKQTFKDEYKGNLH